MRTTITTFTLLFIIFTTLISLNTFSHIRATLTDRLYGDKPVLDNIIIIAIDDDSIQKIGRWPWTRIVFSELIEKIKEAKAIGIDVSFFEHSSSDAQLEATLKKNNNIVLAAEINNDKNYQPIFNTTSGFANLLTDSDGVTRHVALTKIQDTLPFAFFIFKKSWNPAAELPDKIATINFAAPPASFTTYSFADVLQNNYNFSNKIILVGATAPDLHDTYFVPTSRGTAMSGVEIHATIIQNLIRNDFITNQSRLGITIIVLIAGMLGMFIISRLKIQQAILTSICALALYTIISITLANNTNYHLDLFYAPLALIIFTSCGTSIHYFNEKQENKYITNAFGKYISHDLLNQIVAHKHNLNLGGIKTTVTLFFSDIRGFTTISEKLGPEQLVTLLNEYLTSMTTIILNHHGTLDKFIGDAIMAFWNAPLQEPHHAKLACTAAVAQVKALKQLQPQWANRGYPTIDIGCGLNTGEAVIGNMGSTDRFDYTAMGDTVNLASRLESLTKTYGVHIIISETTYTLVKEKFNCRKLDAVKVKGKKIPVTIYELCIDYDETFVKKYEDALQKYFKRNFTEALTMFTNLLTTKENNTSCKLFIERCEHFITEPPADDWDGSYEMKTK